MKTADFEALFSVDAHERRNHPMRAAQAGMRKALPKKFYRLADAEPVEGGLRLVLDGRSARTPGRKEVLLPNRAAAELVTAEWNAQGELIDPATMHATRIVNAALDQVAIGMEAVRDDATRYIGSDLVCYRAGEPERLVALQEEHWAPLLDWAAERFGVRPTLGQGIVFAEQPPALAAAFRDALEAIADPVALAAFHVMVTLSGSAIIALACAEGRIEAEAAFNASELDADFEAEVWGADDEAQARREFRLTEFLAAAALCRAAIG
jgi:chaperone required for assembly of F1-ATPase